MRNCACFMYFCTHACIWLCFKLYNARTNLYVHNNVIYVCMHALVGIGPMVVAFLEYILMFLRYSFVLLGIEQSWLMWSRSVKTSPVNTCNDLPGGHNCNRLSLCWPDGRGGRRDGGAFGCARNSVWTTSQILRHPLSINTSNFPLNRFRSHNEHRLIV